MTHIVCYTYTQAYIHMYHTYMHIPCCSLILLLPAGNTADDDVNTPDSGSVGRGADACLVDRDDSTTVAPPEAITSS